MYRYSCLSLCSKTRSRYVQIIEVVDYLKPVQCSISCRQKVICFCFLLCLCGPVCFWDCSCLHCVTAVIECRVWAWTLLLLSFPVLPPLTSLPSLPRGLPWSVSCSYSAHESSEAKTWASDPQFLLLFLPNCNNVSALWVHIWKENRVFPALQRAQSQDAGFFFREILTLQVWFILGHLVVNVSWDQDRQYIEMSKDALNRSRFTLASFGFLLRDFRKSARTTSSFVYPAFPSIRYMHVRLSPSFPNFALV